MAISDLKQAQCELSAWEGGAVVEVVAFRMFPVVMWRLLSTERVGTGAGKCCEAMGHIWCNLAAHSLPLPSGMGRRIRTHVKHTWVEIERG